MSKRVRTQNPSPQPIAQPRPSTTIRTWLSVSFTLILGTLLVLAAIKQPLGQGYSVYRYSPLREVRTVRAAPCVLIAAGAGAAVWLLALRRKWGGALLSAALVAAAIWVFFAPPKPLDQHAFNFRSLSADGA